MSTGRTLLRALLIGAVVAVLVPATAAQADPSPAQIEKQIDQASDQLEDIIEAYNGITEQLQVTQTAVADLATRIQPLQAQMDAAYANVDQIAASAYKGQSGLATISILISAGSSDSFVDQLTALQHIARAKQRDVAWFTEAKAAFETEKQRLDGLLAQQNGQRAALDARKTTIEADLGKLQALKRRAEAAGRRPAATTGTADVGPPPAVSGRAGVAVQFAYAQRGKPYKWGAAGPGSYDCSGLTQKAWAAAGVGLPHNAAMQWRAIRHVSRGALAPGDLVFYRNLGHVGIYIGGGNVIHAPTSGDVVKVSSVDMMKPYGYGRPG